MNKVELVHSIGATLAKINALLMRDDIADDNAKYQQLIAMQKHLNDQQLSLVRSQIQADDVDFQTYTGLIQAATKELDGQIAAMTSIDKVINIVAQISAGVDEVLKLV